MKFKFDINDPGNIVKKIRDILNGRELGKIVSVDIEGSDIVVKISKLGTSTLTFSPNKAGEYLLSSEKIAFTHKAFKDEVTKKFVSVVEKAGGKLS